jgi:DNA polymerase I-like protein with 3'-5' exonuclease and polymerase domains
MILFLRPECVTCEKRAKTKALVYGLLYGKGVQAFASDLQCDISQAQEHIEAFYCAFPALEEWKKTLMNCCQKPQTDTTPHLSVLSGRIRFFPVRSLLHTALSLENLDPMLKY